METLVIAIESGIIRHIASKGKDVEVLITDMALLSYLKRRIDKGSHTSPPIESYIQKIEADSDFVSLCLEEHEGRDSTDPNKSFRKE